MIEAIIVITVAIIIGINIATTISPRFRRWLYKDHK